MLTLSIGRIGAWIPTYLFAERPQQIPRKVCLWLSRCYFDPFLLRERGYVVVKRSWWKTLITDLMCSLDEIYRSFDKKSTRYSLNVAQRLLSSSDWRVVPPSPHTEEDDVLIVDFYVRKQLGENDSLHKLANNPTRPHWLTSRAWYKGQLVLVRTNVCDPQAGITRSLYAVSGNLPEELRRDAGHISRWLCWQDIQFYKQEGYRIYDWGGISKHGELAGIDEFKKSFGGKPAVVHDALVCWRPLAPLLRRAWKIRFGCYPEVEDYEGEADSGTT